MTPEEIEEAALDYASAALQIPRSEPGADDALRKSGVYASRKLHLHGNEVVRPFVELVERILRWLIRRGGSR